MSHVDNLLSSAQRQETDGFSEDAASSKNTSSLDLDDVIHVFANGDTEQIPSISLRNM